MLRAVYHGSGPDARRPQAPAGGDPENLRQTGKELKNILSKLLTNV